jgi:hypothetical protein
MAVDHTTAKDIAEAAYKAVTEAGIPEPLQEVAFGKAFDLLSGDASAPAAPASPGAPGAPDTPKPSTPAKPTSGASLNNIAAKLGLGIETVEKVYGVAGEELEIVVPTSSLTQKARPAMRELILLTAAGRQAGGWDEGSTDVPELRVVCEHYGGKYYDGNNFGNAIKDQHDHLRTSGKRKGMTVRVLPAGYTAGAELVKKMAGEG